MMYSARVKVVLNGKPQSVAREISVPSSMPQLILIAGKALGLKRAERVFAATGVDCSEYC